MNKIASILLLLIVVYSVRSYNLEDLSRMLNKTIIVWDNDGTIMGSKDPQDTIKVILPNIRPLLKLYNS